MSPEQLRPGWRKVKFGDVVRDVKNTTKDPARDGLHRVVGLDLLDPESLPLRRWDELADLPDGTSFTRTFKAGQVLFGKRRAYQRKVAVPDFDGICSGDILVFEPASPDLLPAFLPYLVQSDGFFDHALGTSAGSLSPRTKWQELAKYEFALPPLDEQKRIVEVMATSDTQAEGLAEAGASLRAVRDAIAEHELWAADWSRRPLTESLNGGECFDGDWIESKDQAPAGVRLLQLADIGSGSFLNKSSRYVSEQTFKRLGCHEVLPGDLLISRMADPIGRTCEVPELGERLITAVDVCVVRPAPGTAPTAYWLALLNSPSWTRSCLRASSGSTRTRVSRRKLESIEVPDPPSDVKASLAQRFQSIANAEAAALAHQAGARRLRAELLSALLLGGRR